MLGPSRNGARALPADLLSEVHAFRADASRVAVVWQGRQGDVAAFKLGARDELPLALIPRGQDLGRRRTAQDARVDEPRELDVRDVPGRAVDSLKVPDCFRPVVCELGDLRTKGNERSEAA